MTSNTSVQQVTSRSTRWLWNSYGRGMCGGSASKIYSRKRRRGAVGFTWNANQCAKIRVITIWTMNQTIQWYSCRVRCISFCKFLSNLNFRISFYLKLSVAEEAFLKWQNCLSFNMDKIQGSFAWQVQRVRGRRISTNFDRFSPHVFDFKMKRYECTKIRYNSIDVRTSNYFACCLCLPLLWQPLSANNKPIRYWSKPAFMTPTYHADS